MNRPALIARMAQALRTTPETLRHVGSTVGESGVCACGVLYAVLHDRTIEDLIKVRPEDENVVYLDLRREAKLEPELIFADNDGTKHLRGIAPTWPEMADKLLRGEYDAE